MSLTEIAMFHGLGLGLPLLADNGVGEILTNREFWAGLYAHGLANRQPRDEAFVWFSGVVRPSSGSPTGRRCLESLGGPVEGDHHTSRDRTLLAHR